MNEAVFVPPSFDLSLHMSVQPRYVDAFRGLSVSESLSAHQVEKSFGHEEDMGEVGIVKARIDSTHLENKDEFLRFLTRFAALIPDYSLAALSLYFSEKVHISPEDAPDFVNHPKRPLQSPLGSILPGLGDFEVSVSVHDSREYQFQSIEEDGSVAFFGVKRSELRSPLCDVVGEVVLDDFDDDDEGEVPEGSIFLKPLDEILQLIGAKAFLLREQTQKWLLLVKNP